MMMRIRRAGSASRLLDSARRSSSQSEERQLALDVLAV